MHYKKAVNRPEESLVACHAETLATYDALDVLYFLSREFGIDCLLRRHLSFPLLGQRLQCLRSNVHGYEPQY